jgi:phosphatidylethanolamine/phosphatidyl-N-methylethanolamine N-methyltransferase
LTRLDADAVRVAYRRQAAFYDLAFGAVATAARRRAIAAVNALPGTRVLEVGVGTGLALPRYRRDARVTGIDLSADMLARARDRVAAEGLTHVEALLELDAEQTGFADASFDIAAAMFVASVVPHPDRLLAELKRVVKPGGHILFVNHFSASGGLRLAIERAMAPLGRSLGWHPDFPVSALLGAEDRARATMTPMPPAGIFTLVHLDNVASQDVASQKVANSGLALAARPDRAM